MTAELYVKLSMQLYEKNWLALLLLPLPYLALGILTLIRHEIDAGGSRKKELNGGSLLGKHYRYVKYCLYLLYLGTGISSSTQPKLKTKSVGM